MSSILQTLLPISFLLFKVILLVSGADAASKVSPLPAVQAHFGGVTYAGGMAYDSVHQVVYVTGQVGANGCFVGLMKDFTWISRHVLPEPAICQTMITPNKAQEAFLLATTEEGGLYTDTRVVGSDRAALYGLAMTMEFTPSGDAQLSAKRHHLMHLNEVQYPRSIVIDPQHDNYVYIVSMDSENKNQNGATGSAAGISNLTPGGITTYGSAYTMTVRRILSNDFSKNWVKEFGLQSEKHGNRVPSVDVAQMIWNKGTLLIVGSTKGSGLAFGEADSEDFFHGYITKIDPNTGMPLQQGGETAKAVQRIALGGGAADTHVMAICSNGDDDDFIYVVGMSKISDGLSTPFLAKFNAVTLEQEWLQQLDERTSDAYGLACGTDGTYVYMAGIIDDGGSIASGATSNGGDDIFVLKLSTTDGSVQWIHQIGTSGDDRLAHGGSGLLVTDHNIMLYGDTSGDLYATAEQSHEVFVAQIEFDGTLPGTTESTGVKNMGGSVAIVTTLRADVDNSKSETPPPEPAVVPTPRSPDPNIKLEKGSGYRGVFFMALILALFFAVGYIMQKRKAQEGTERALVFSYLQAFDVEDMDVRHSATGGWHGTYVGKLAQGESGSTAHSSIVKDSLFVDYDTAPASLGGSSTDLETEDDIDRYIEGALSFGERKANLSGKSSTGDDPWGKDII